MNTTEVLNKAADLLEQHEWYRSGVQNESHGRRFCVFTAINEVVAEYVNGHFRKDRTFDTQAGWKLEDFAMSRLHTVLGFEPTRSNAAVYDWNDHIAKDKQEAVNKLREAASLTTN